MSETSFLEKRFSLAKNGTTVKTEVLAGLTTFLAMSYILAVNPNILGAAGMPRGGLLVATALSAFVGTGLMAMLSNYPIAQAPGMGLNAYFAFTVVLGMGYSWQFALFAVFVEGLIFIALSLSTVREAIFNAFSMSLKHAVSAGLGIFIALIALSGAHIIVDNPATLMSFHKFSQATLHTHDICAILALLGVIITAVLIQRKVSGAILWGILVTWGLGMIAQATDIYRVDPEMQCYSLYPTLSFATFGDMFKEFGTICGAAFNAKAWSCSNVADTEGLSLLKSLNFPIVMFAFLFSDVFDTLGTTIGVTTKAGLLDKDGRLPRIRGVLLADSLATSIGAIFGTSTTTSYVESASGVAVGGRTGLTAWTTALLFLVSLFFAPVFLAIPAFATAPALVMVGFYMMMNITKIDFTQYHEAIPAYLTIITIPLAYSISDGICVGIISWTLMNLCAKNGAKVHPLFIVLSILFILKYIYL